MASTVTAKPTGRPHGGWDPVGNLTTIWTPPHSFCYDFRPTMTFTNDSEIWHNPACTRQASYYVYERSPYYSPAICPYSMTSAGTRPDGFGPALEATEFATLCCYSSLTLSLPFNGGQTPYCFTTLEYWSLQPSTQTVSSFVYTRSTYFVDTTVVRLLPVQVRWAPTDLSILSPAPTLPSSSTPTSTPTATDSGAPISNGLSKGAQAGVAVGVIFFILALAGLGIFATRRRRQLSQQAAAQPESRTNQSSVEGASSSAAPVLIPPVTDLSDDSNRLSDATFFLGSPQQQQYKQVLQDAILTTTSPAPSHSTSTHPLPRSFSPPSYAQRPGSAPGIAASTGSGNDRQEIEEEFRRLQERRTRLVEIHRLSLEEDRLRSHLSGEVPPESMSELMDTGKSG